MLALIRVSALTFFVCLATPSFAESPPAEVIAAPAFGQEKAPGQETVLPQESVLRQENLVAWCIVPFDAAQRTPAERAQMLQDLAIQRCAYDWREEHVPSFEQEIIEYRKRGIEFFAFWGEHPDAYRLFEKYDLHPQIWMMPPSPNEGTQAERVQQAAEQLVSAAEQTRRLGCKLALYNHGGWAGEPENLVAICRDLRERGYDHVGITYNLHHGHDHIADWQESFQLMMPYLHCLNLNGMNDGEKPKILGIGKGEHELDMIRFVVDSGYQGPIGILDHRPELDAKDSLTENIEGLRWLRDELKEPGSGGAKPKTPVPHHSVSVPPVQVEPQSTSNLFPGSTAAAHQPGTHDHSDARTPLPAAVLPYDASLVNSLVSEAMQRGDALRGARVFASAQTACLSCHQVGPHGGTIGPRLSGMVPKRDLPQWVESVLWPDRVIAPEFVTWQILTDEGQILSGYRIDEDERSVTLRDPASGEETVIARERIEDEIRGNTPMPAGLTAAMTRQQQRDLIRFLAELSDDTHELSMELDHALSSATSHGPASFPLTLAPLSPERWQHANHHVNRDRIYDFYTKQAEHFRQQDSVPMLLSAFPGLDGGEHGHWGNQTEETWASDRWQQTVQGTVLAGVFRGNGKTVARAVCVQLGDPGELSVCFNPDTLSYEAVWKGGFISLSAVRHGFVQGLELQGEVVPVPPSATPNEPFKYHGFYRHGKRVVFSYRIGDTEYLDSPRIENGTFARDRAPLDEHPLRSVLEGGAAQWPQTIQTRIVPGTGEPFAIDTIELPLDNPWKALLFCSAHDFLPDGSALVCTMQGDVWHVTGLQGAADQPAVATWRRFAAGLHHPLGLVVAADGIYVQCRDQLTRLSDINGDGEADYYECFSNAMETSPAGHDFICGLQRDSHGNFYTASGNQGLLRIAPDGSRADVIATGFRNPDGLGILPDGSLTVPCSEGEWTPASMICLVPGATEQSPGDSPTHYGYGGPRANQAPSLPLAYLPRGMDNSSGGQVVVPAGVWGSLQGQLLHLSFGAGTWFTVLQDEVDGQKQGAIVPMAGDFRSGAHRGRFSPADKNLYVTGMQGWGAYVPESGSFQRVRYTGQTFQMPIDFHVHENGVRIQFAEPVDPAFVADTKNHFAQCWNYRYSAAYGSPEYSPTHHGAAGHDPLRIASAHALPDERSVFLEIPDLQPVNQLHLRLHVNADDAYRTSGRSGTGHDLILTVHRLDAPFEDFAGYQVLEKTVAAHPMLTDLALSAVRVPNPWRDPIAGARPIELVTGTNLTFQTKTIHVRVNEPLALTLANPDVVPHNWALVRPGALQRVGELANRLIADPHAFARHYIPESDDVLFYTDVVAPSESQTVYFHAPAEPGRYPFLCTFPGHWMVMNGELIVE